MDAERIKDYVKDCLLGQKPPCIASCPVGLDIYSFIKNLKRGNINRAYREYRDKVVFPRIACRICEGNCRNHCLRAQFDQAIDMPQLELACAELAGNSEPASYNLPVKPQHVLIVGAGLSGMTCALRLAAQKYRVTVYEASGQIGGILKDQMDTEIFLKEFGHQFSREKYELVTNSYLSTLKGVEYDAAYIATGSGGEIFTAEPDQTRIFRGGGLCSAKGLEIIRDGRQAAADIKAYFDLGFRDEKKAAAVNEAKLNMDFSNLTSIPAVVPADRYYTKAEAQREAGRCLLCECHSCRDKCELLNYYDKTPYRVADDVYATLHPVPSYTDRMATRFSNSCNQCDLCKDSCPQNIDIGALLLATRREMHRQKTIPPVFHDFWLRDMGHAMGPTYLAMAPAKDGKCRRVFFPGCQLGASEPQYVLRAYDFLRQEDPDTGIILACCGVPAEWAGDEERRDQVHAVLREELERMGNPEIITACPTCQKTLIKYLPVFNYISLYYLLAGSEVEKIPVNAGDKRISVFDPCSARSDAETTASVRELLKKSSYQIEELELHSENAVCCGFGGHIYPANPEQMRRVVKTRISENDLPYIVYCSNCRDVFAATGKNCRHILEAVFGIERKGQALEISKRHYNRLKTRQNVLREHFAIDETLTSEENHDQRYRFSQEALEEIKKMLLLREEVISVVKAAEQSGGKIYNKNRDLYISHLPADVLTVWVEYRKEQELTEIVSVYSHRMRIEGG